MRSRKAGLPFATRAWKRELCLKSYVSRITRTENFLSQKFYKLFLEVHVSSYPDHYEPKIFFRFLKSGLEGSPIMSVNVRLMTKKHLIESKKGQDIGGPGRTNIMRLFRTRFWTEGFPFVMRSRKAGLPFATRVLQCPSESANVRPSPPMSVQVC